MEDKQSISTEVTQRHERLLIDNPWMLPDNMAIKVEQILTENASAKSKRAKIFRIADAVNVALALHVACKPGCSQCCHMSTLIFLHEAERLAAVSGRAIHPIGYRSPADVLAAGEKFYRRPCPFLVNDMCSVYDDRPLVCRTHHSLNNNADNCDMSVPLSEKKGVAMYNPDYLETPYISFTRAHNPIEPWGNIGEFFPD